MKFTKWDGATLEARFWSKVDKTGGCWEWTASKRRTGYGKFNFEGKTSLAHRVSYYLVYKSWPEVCMHICDNPSCVRPDHLRSATQAENMRDCYLKGRTARGSRNGVSKLSESKISEIRSQLPFATQGEIASRFGVSQTTISHIVRGSVWRHA